MRRVLRGAKPHDPHRTHAYQYAARLHGGHRPIVLAVAMINECWLLPLAVASQQGHVDGVIALLIASAPVLWLVLHYRAGVPERPS